MYCKYCGSEITSNITRCVSCGANIDLNDGGQSFLEDNELSLWKNSTPYRITTSVPKTEMRERLPQTYLSEAEDKFETAGFYPSVAEKKSSSRTKSKIKLFGGLKLSSSNKFIIFCISLALVIVLMAVAVIAILDDEPEEAEKTDEASTQITNETVVENDIPTQPTGNDEVQTQVQPEEDAPKQVQSEAQKQAQVGENTPENGESKELEQAQSEENPEKEKVLVENVRIKKSDKDIKMSTSLYRINGVIYVNAYDILKHEGYIDKVKTNGGNYVFDHKQNSNQKIEISTDGKEVWIRTEANVLQKESLQYDSMLIEDAVYVPAKDFLEKMGFEEYDFDEDENVLSYK